MCITDTTDDQLYNSQGQDLQDTPHSRLSIINFQSRKKSFVFLGQIKGIEKKKVSLLYSIGFDVTFMA